MQLRDIMTSNVRSVSSNSKISDAARIMKDLNVGSVPVVENNRPVGIVTDRDITIRNVASNINNDTAVNQIMSHNLVYGTPDMSEKEAARLMSEHQIRRLPIIENDQLVGIISLGDLAVNNKSDMEAGKALSTISIPSTPQNK